MSKKMKVVALDSSPYGPYEDAKARFKHQTLIQDYQELQKDTEAMRNKFETMKQKKSTLLAEVRFLQRRHKFLLKNKASKPPQGQELVQQRNFGSQCMNTVKEKNYSRKEANLRNVLPILDVNQKEKICTAKEFARRNPSPVLDLNQNDRIHSRKVATLRNTTLVFDLNHEERTYRGSPTPILDLIQKERFLSGKETIPRNPVPSFDLNQMGRTHIGREDAVQTRAPIFDLNQISGEEEELQNHYEPLKMEEPKKLLIRGGTDEQLNDMKLSICRNAGNGPNRMGKRKISWQDQVALKV